MMNIKGANDSNTRSVERNHLPSFGRCNILFACSKIDFFHRLRDWKFNRNLRSWSLQVGIEDALTSEPFRLALTGLKLESVMGPFLPLWQRCIKTSVV